MSNQIYVLISNSNGDTCVEQMTPEDILEGIENGEYGENPRFFTTISDSYPNTWPDNSYLLLKCEIVTPKPVEIVKRWAL